jgi:hypothetical protein
MKPLHSKSGRLSLSDIRARDKGYFFSRDTMRFFPGKLSSRFVNGKNYVVYVSSGELGGRKAVYRFDEKSSELR